MQPSDNQASINSQANIAVTDILNKPLLQQGSQGDAVREVQLRLTKWGNYKGAIDGIFSIQVKNAVIAYQHRVFLVEDGVVGNFTWQALYTGTPVNMPTLSLNSSGNAVVTLQQVLTSTQDYPGRIDGEFGSRTKAAVIAFQERTGLIADGIVGDRTWYYLSKVPH
jgi:peptidoglycan hydrolase-like protein with peptidoglycan-binding domain